MFTGNEIKTDILSVQDIQSKITKETGWLARDQGDFCHLIFNYYFNHAQRQFFWIQLKNYAAIAYDSLVTSYEEFDKDIDIFWEYESVAGDSRNLIDYNSMSGYLEYIHRVRQLVKDSEKHETVKKEAACKTVANHYAEYFKKLL